MKLRIRVMLVLFLASLMFLNQAHLVRAICLKKGELAPDFTLPDLSGREISLYDFLDQDQIILVVIWGVWCPYCREMMVRLKSFYQKFQDQGLQLIGVSIRESQFKVSMFIDKLKPGFPILIDEWGELKKPYNVLDVPRSVLLDSKGIVKYSEITTSHKEVIAQVKKALKNK